MRFNSCNDRPIFKWIHQVTVLPNQGLKNICSTFSKINSENNYFFILNKTVRITKSYFRKN